MNVQYMNTCLAMSITLYMHCDLGEGKTVNG